MADWVKVYQDQKSYRAEMVRAILEEKELDPVVLSKFDSQYHLGHFEVLVPPDQVLFALRTINQEINFE